LHQTAINVNAEVNQYMEFGLLNVMQIAGAIGIFIYGMKLMSEGIQRAAGNQLRNTLSNLTNNKWLGFLTGFIVTGLIQSSSATTVMIVSFVNAGLLSVVQSAGLVMGANVGTTVTGWLVSLFGFKVSLIEYSVPLFAIGVPMLFVYKAKMKYWGECIIGFSLIFLGLGFLRDAVPEFTEQSLLFEWLKEFTQNGIWSRLFFVVVGIIIAAIVQSSSVAMAVTLTMCAQGWLPLEIAASLILGENIGTTTTALIASLIANKEAKTASRVHFLFNVIGVMWMVLLLPWFLPVLSSFLNFAFGTVDIYNNHLDMTIGLSAFHTSFNLINSLILINFIAPLSKLASIGLQTEDTYSIIKDKTRIKFLENTGNMPEMATIQLQKETKRFGEIIIAMSSSFKEIINTTDIKKQQKLIKRTKQYEELTDQLEVEITEYITLLSKEEMTSQTSLILRTILNICNDLERIADIYLQLSIVLQKKIEENIYFIPEQREKINELASLVEDAIRIMNENLAETDYRSVKKYQAVKSEKQINQYRDLMREEHLNRMGQPDYNIKSAMVYNNVFQSLERIGDHVVNVTEAVVGEI